MKVSCLARTSVTTLVLLVGSSLSVGCNQREPVPDFTRRIDDRHDSIVQIAEIGIESTSELGIPAGNFNPPVAKLPMSLSAGQILRLSGSFSIADGGVAPLTVIVFICPRGKATMRDSFANFQANTVFEPEYPAPNSHFELDIRLPNDKFGQADIVLYAFGDSWSSIRLLATLKCEISDQSSHPPSKPDEPWVITFD